VDARELEVVVLRAALEVGGRVRMDSRMRRCAGVSCEVVSMPDTVAPVGIGRARSRTGADPGR
jgi:hypothetical protein